MAFAAILPGFEVHEIPENEAGRALWQHQHF